MTDQLPRGTVPPGTYAGGGRSPIVWVMLCPACAGYAPTVPEDSPLYPVGAHCQGCGAYVREVHQFQALILSAANGGCFCEGHRQVTGDLPTEESVMQLWTEVKTRPALAAKMEVVSPSCPSCGNATPEYERGLLYCGACGHTWGCERR